MKREKLSSQLSFILLSAGCAIGLGNVWRFPYITGKYGGGLFVLFYLLFSLILGLPVLIMEFSIGRASTRNIGGAYQVLEKKGSKWHYWGPIAIIGNYLLIMFYSTITGWIIYYFFHSFNLAGVNIANPETFDALIGNPLTMFLWMSFAIILCFSIVSIGLKKGVEKITKIMMSLLILLMIFLAINSLTLKGSSQGLKFFLLPSLDGIKQYGLATVLYEAMAQAFFSLSIGMGGMTIFASYLNKSRTLTGESLKVIGLDTFVALMSGIIILPAAFAFNIEPGSGPSLLFISMPNIFKNMSLGFIWQSVFFLFMSFAALTTLIGVFENIVAYWMEQYNVSRARACFFNAIILIILSIPCILGFNVLKNFQPLGEGTMILDLEDFLVSRTIMPIGSLLLVIFISNKRGWSFKAFLEEVNTGKGLKFPAISKFYIKYILPIIILVVFIAGYYEIFSKL